MFVDLDIGAWRRSHGFSMERAARALGVTAPTIHRKEHGQSETRAPLALLAAYFDKYGPIDPRQIELPKRPGYLGREPAPVAAAPIVMERVEVKQEPTPAAAPVVKALQVEWPELRGVMRRSGLNARTIDAIEARYDRGASDANEMVTKFSFQIADECEHNGRVALPPRK